MCTCNVLEWPIHTKLSEIPAKTFLVKNLLKFRDLWPSKGVRSLGEVLHGYRDGCASLVVEEFSFTIMDKSHTELYFT